MMSIIGTRLVASAAVLAVLTVLQLTIPRVLPNLIAGALIVLPIICWAAFGFFLARALEDPTILSLRARVQDALALALAQTVGAFLGLIIVLRALEVIPPVDRGVFTVGITFCLVMIAAPAVNWLLTWRPWRSA